MAKQKLFIFPVYFSTFYCYINISLLSASERYCIPENIFQAGQFSF